MDKSFLRKLHDCGFSIIPVDEHKRPIGAWKQYQQQSRTKTEIDSLNSPLYGAITGYNGLEVIDVDCKVIQSISEQNKFFDEFLNLLRDNIDDFDLKFVIAKTKNRGYHILYRCSVVQGNTKIAKLQGCKEAIIESRGVGGMVVIYDNMLSNLQYSEVQTITERDREILWEICKIYNSVPEIEEPKELKTTQKTIGDFKISVWEDYNNRVRIWDLISDEFSIVKKLSDKSLIKRNGAKSLTSGTLFDSNKIFLFSTGTQYPNEKPLSPFDIYAIKFCNSDYKRAAKELYQKNYGSRFEKELPTIKTKISEKINIEQVETNVVFPIDVFPTGIQQYFLECQSKLSSSVDFMGCSMLWLLSLIIGNSMKIRVKNGWVESCNVWISLVGEAGIGKTPSVSKVIFPLEKMNNQEIRRYMKHYEKYQAYESLDKKEKALNEEVRKPLKTQMIVNDVTIEACVELHEENKNSIGIFKDELAGWFKDMNKYRQGSDLEFWLSSWSNKGIAVNRKTAKSSFVESPILPVLGGIQPNILVQFFTEENKDNGFIDRMLTSYPELVVEKYNEGEISQELIDWYDGVIVGFFNHIKSDIITVNYDGEIESKIWNFSPEAKTEWIRIFNEITDSQNSDNENEYLKSMYPKQKSYIPRFALMTAVLNSFFNSQYTYIIEKQDILNAEKLSKYFVSMAKKHKILTIEKTSIKQTIEENKKLTTKEKITAILKDSPNTKVKIIAEMLGITRQAVDKHIKSME